MAPRAAVALAALASAVLAGEERAEALARMKQSTQTVLDQCDAVEYDDAAPRHFDGHTLGFVTPWHAEKGKAAALKYAKKFDYINPFWYHIELTEIDEKVENWRATVEPASTTPHGAPDAEWAAALQAEGVKVIPVFAFYGWSRDEMGTFFLNKKAGTPQFHLVRMMMKACADVNCDGLMLEWGPVPVTEYYKPCFAFLQRIRGSFQKFFPTPKELQLSVHADLKIFERATAAAMMPVVSKYVLHAYNFTGPMLQHGPLAPMPWVKDTLAQWKMDVKIADDSLGGVDLPTNGVIVVLPFFGREYRLDSPGIDPESYDGEDLRDANGRLYRYDVTAEQYLEVLKTQNVKHSWDNDNKEHSLRYTEDGIERVLYFPSPKFLQRRIQLLDGPVTGLGIWNLGTGLEYFFDLI